MIRKLLILSAMLAGWVLPATAELRSAESADDYFRGIHEAEWNWRVNAIGIDDDADEVRKIRSDFRDASLGGQAAKLDYLERVWNKLDLVPEQSLSSGSRIDYLVYRPQIEALLAKQRFRDYEMPLNSSGGFWGRAQSYARKPYRTESDYRTYISLLRAIPAHFDENIINMRAGLARGFTQPQTVLAGRDAPIAAVAEAKPEETVFYGPFRDMAAGLPKALQEELRAEATMAIHEAVIPSYRGLLAFLRDEYIPGARTTIAAQALPDGSAYYQSKIHEYVTLDLFPDEIHEIGLAEVAKLRIQMNDAMRETDFPGELPEFLEFLRTDPRFYPTSEEELLKEAAWISNRFDSISEQWFGRMPRKRFGIRPMAAETAPFSSYASGGPGYYLINTYDLPSRPLYVLTALTLHEAAPGHAFQMPLAAENSDQPAFRKKVYMSAYGEGWALYCEKLGVEMGLYETPYDLFGMLNYQIWRAARLVVDTGIHAKGWSRERAIAYMKKNTALSIREIESEVDRYISVPGQALSYYLGQLAIEKARAKAQAALGDQFDIREFHDIVLETGSVPLPVLETIVDSYVAGKLAGRGRHPVNR